MGHPGRRVRPESRDLEVSAGTREPMDCPAVTAIPAQTAIRGQRDQRESVANPEHPEKRVRMPRRSLDDEVTAEHRDRKAPKVGCQLY